MNHSTRPHQVFFRCFNTLELFYPQLLIPYYVIYRLLRGVSIAQNESAQNIPRAVLKLLFRPNKNAESILNMHKR